MRVSGGSPACRGAPVGTGLKTRPYKNGAPLALHALLKTIEFA
jgi:hypothetical protein